MSDTTISNQNSGSGAPPSTPPPSSAKQPDPNLTVTQNENLVPVRDQNKMGVITNIHQVVDQSKSSLSSASTDPQTGNVGSPAPSASTPTLPAAGSDTMPNPFFKVAIAVVLYEITSQISKLQQEIQSTDNVMQIQQRAAKFQAVLAEMSDIVDKAKVQANQIEMDAYFKIGEAIASAVVAVAACVPKSYSKDQREQMVKEDNEAKAKDPSYDLKYDNDWKKTPELSGKNYVSNEMLGVMNNLINNIGDATVKLWIDAPATMKVATYDALIKLLQYQEDSYQKAQDSIVGWSNAAGQNVNDVWRQFQDFMSKLLSMRVWNG